MAEYNNASVYYDPIAQTVSTITTEEGATFRGGIVYDATYINRISAGMAFRVQRAHQPVSSSIVFVRYKEEKIFRLFVAASPTITHYLRYQIWETITSFVVTVSSVVNQVFLHSDSLIPVVCSQQMLDLWHAEFYAAGISAFVMKKLQELTISNLENNGASSQ